MNWPLKLRWLPHSVESVINFREASSKESVDKSMIWLIGHSRNSGILTGELDFCEEMVFGEIATQGISPSKGLGFFGTLIGF